MQQRRDIIDIKGLPRNKPLTSSKGPRRQFLSIWYRCCHAYGRLYRNEAATAYEGRCPRCGANARVGISPDGTSQRSFEAQ